MSTSWRRKPLTPQQQAFLLAYLDGPTAGNAAAAARIAGYGAAKQRGHKLRYHPRLVRLLDAVAEARSLAWSERLARTLAARR